MTKKRHVGSRKAPVSHFNERSRARPPSMSILRASSRGALRALRASRDARFAPPAVARWTTLPPAATPSRLESSNATEQAQQLADDIKRGMEEAAPLARGTLAAEHLTRVNALSVSSSTSTAPEASASDASPLPPREPSSLSPSPAVVYLDTLEMSREFRRAGFDQAQAETITRVVLAAVRASTEPLATRADLDKHVLSTRSDLKQYHQDVASRHREASAASKHTHDVLLAECEKLRQELRYAHEKVSTSQKLDLNLERGRIRDDLQTNAEQTSQMEIRLDREIGNMKTTIEAAKSDIIKYSLASVMSMAAVGMSLMRLLM